MLISKLHIVNYKNYKDVQIHFHDHFNVITGLNGKGKTNLIDAIHYLGLTRSYFSNTDIHNYRHGEDFFRIVGEFSNDAKSSTIVCKVQKRQTKIFEKNKKKYEKLMDHIGTVPIVMVAPKDHSLINDGSEERRKLIDSTISQLDSDYLRNLVEYNYILKQRNQLLKDYPNRKMDEPLLDIYDSKLSISGQFIYEKRKEYLGFMKPVFEEKYAIISKDHEACAFEYQSKLHQDSLENLLKNNRSKDLILQRSSVGIHKDDILFFNEENMIRHVGSQGQQKSFILALKLAQFDLIYSRTQIKPIILLDDIFDRLDSTRVFQLISLLQSQHLGQIFITDTEKDRLKSIFEELKYDFFLFEVDDNTAKQINDEKT